jgi:hypothetical protein
MVTLTPGKTLQIYVPREHKREVETWIENFRIARKTLEKMSSVNRALLKQRNLFPGG